MNDAKSLFREGILALRERKDVAEARRLLTQSLKIDPHNEMAWIWLSRTMNNPEKRLECVERALAINPLNEKARALKQQLTSQQIIFEETGQKAPSKPVQDAARKLTTEEEKRIKSLLKKADTLVEEGNVESAIEQWVHVLDIQVDHELAMRNAVGYLSRLKYVDDARELVWRALQAGTQHPSIYLTAIDIARHQRDEVEASRLREELARLPDVDDGVVATIIDYLIKDERPGEALDLLSDVIENHPKSQKLLTRMADLHKMIDQDTEALRYYDRAARMGTGTKEGREADRKLLEHAPVLTDKERGSVALAWREAAGVALIFVILGWHDAGLDLLNLDGSHWLGVLLALVGGYLLVTATSSPQQKPLATWLGGSLPDKSKHSEDDKKPGIVEEMTELPIISTGVRLVIGVLGASVLGVAFTLVFSTAINLLMNPVQPFDIPTLDQLLTGKLW